MNESTDVFSPERIYRRRDLHAKLGGQRQGGISTPANAPVIILITGDSGNDIIFDR
jgi:5-methylcytosine-specific restriction protein A